MTTRSEFTPDDDYQGGGGAIFWALWFVLFFIGLTMTLLCLYLARVDGAVWLWPARVGAVILALCSAAVWKMWTARE